jgi:hypothetical protein
MSTGTVSYTIYAAIAASWVAWVVFTYARLPRFATFGGIVRRWMRRPLWRWILWASWAFVGWHFFARGSGAFK